MFNPSSYLLLPSTTASLNQYLSCRFQGVDSNEVLSGQGLGLDGSVSSFFDIVSVCGLWNVKVERIVDTVDN